MSKDTQPEDLLRHLAKARAAHRAASAKRRNAERFQVAERLGNTHTLVGWAQLSGYTGLKIASLRVLFSKGGGKLERTITNVHTGEPALVTITRLGEPQQPEQPKPKRGRPPHVMPAADAEQLGTEAEHSWRPRPYRGKYTRKKWA